jgi:hypothetical protein
MLPAAEVAVDAIHPVALELHQLWRTSKDVALAGVAGASVVDRQARSAGQVAITSRRRW